MLTFYPKFEINNNLNDLLEIIFLIDVSNSMDGKHVQQAKQLVHLFLTNIKQERNIYFNIVTFGSGRANKKMEINFRYILIFVLDNDECFPISVPNTKENLDKAKHYFIFFFLYILILILAFT
jgi:hypothetical protein